MNILLMGDVVGAAGCQAVRKGLPDLKKRYTIDFVVVNGENSAEGNGILPLSAKHLFDSGVDVITTGNHVFRRKEMTDMLEMDDVPVIRPANYHVTAPGKGFYIYDKLTYRICVINLQGVVYLSGASNPFDKMDEILKEVQAEVILIDFHAEATAEKLALAYYLDGKVTAVVGTHTHIQTADERILPSGTGYITDLGMCGVFDSILGIKPSLAVNKMRTNLPVRFENELGVAALSGIVISVDIKSGKTTSIQRVQ